MSEILRLAKNFNEHSKKQVDDTEKELKSVIKKHKASLSEELEVSRNTIKDVIVENEKVLKSRLSNQSLIDQLELEDQALQIYLKERENRRKKMVLGTWSTLFTILLVVLVLMMVGILLLGKKISNQIGDIQENKVEIQSNEKFLAEQNQRIEKLRSLVINCKDGEVTYSCLKIKKEARSFQLKDGSQMIEIQLPK